jgi:hypothetical protein
VGATCHEPEKGPDFTKTSQDGYTFDTWWEAQTLARNIIAGHTQVSRSHLHPHVVLVQKSCRSNWQLISGCCGGT